MAPHHFASLRRYAAARHFYWWLALAVTLSVLSLSTVFSVQSIPLPLVAFWGERVTGYFEIISLLLGLVGAILVQPRLASWEIGGSRNLSGYAATETLLVCLLSIAPLVLAPFGAVDPGPVEPRDEFQSRAFATLIPYAISLISYIALAIIAINHLGKARGIALILSLICFVWFSPPRITHWLPFHRLIHTPLVIEAGLDSPPLPVIIGFATLCLTAAAIDSALRGHRWTQQRDA